MTPKELRGALRRQLNPRRATWQKPAVLVRALGLRRGQVVAEIGSVRCGGGDVRSMVAASTRGGSMVFHGLSPFATWAA